MKEKVTCFSIFKNSFGNLDQPANLKYSKTTVQSQYSSNNHINYTFILNFFLKNINAIKMRLMTFLFKRHLVLVSKYDLF